MSPKEGKKRRNGHCLCFHHKTIRLGERAQWHYDVPVLYRFLMLLYGFGFRFEKVLYDEYRVPLVCRMGWHDEGAFLNAVTHCKRCGMPVEMSGTVAYVHKPEFKPYALPPLRGTYLDTVIAEDEDREE